MCGVSYVRSMRWLIDARPLVDPNPGGVSRVARGLISAFCALAREDEIILATTGQNKFQASGFGFSALPAGRQVAGFRHIHLRLPNKIWSAAACAGITSLDQEIEKRAGKIDGIFLPNLGFVGRLRQPYTLLLHDLSFLMEPRWFSRKMRLWHKAVRPEELIRNAASLLSVSETTKRDAVKLLGIPKNKITVIPMGPTIQNMRDARCAMRDAPRYILVLGADDPRKNAKLAVEAIKILKQEKGFEDIELILIGSKNRVSNEKLAELYQNASAFLYPSWYEGYGLPLHEAAAYGTPRVASTTGALPETAPRGTLFADPAKPHHWAEALKMILIKNSHDLQPTTYSPQPADWSPAAQILLKTLQTASCGGSSFCST